MERTALHDQQEAAVQAAQITSFGGADALQLREAELPQPGPGEVRVAVSAASVNGHDVIVRSGGLKTVSGRRFPIGIGLDFVGTIDALGPGVDGRAVGDRVWGTVHPQRKHVIGSAAEAVVVATDRVAAAPASLDDTAAAALVVAGTTALIALDRLALQPGGSLLVRGAAGGVGSAAVQLAHARGLRVTAIAGARSAEAVRALGADAVIDRSAADPRAIGRFDGVLDLAGTRLGAWRRTVARNGRMVTVALSGPAILAIALSTVHGSRRIRTFSANPTAPELTALTRAVEAGSIAPVVASVRPLREIADAHRAFEQGGALGKHVLVVRG